MFLGAENVPILSQNNIVIDVNKETCVASGSGSKNGEDCSIAVEEIQDVYVEPLDSTERKIEEVFPLSIADRKHIDPKESQDLKMQEKEAGVVSCDAENKNDASVTVAAIDSCVASGIIEKGSGSNPSVSRKKLLVLDLNGLLANIVSSFPGCKADRVIGRRASEFLTSIVVSPYQFYLINDSLVSLFMLVFKRPFYEDFLNFCFEKFEVGIWSSRTQ